MNFQRGQFSAKFGCNHFGGHYRITEGVLVTSDVIITTMACREPATSFERLGEAIVSSPMQVGMDLETRGPVLFNGAGRINLTPVGPTKVT